MESETKPEIKHEQKDLVITMDRLITSMEKLTKIQTKIQKQGTLGPTILRATAYALGSTLGLAVVVSILFYILKVLGIFDSMSTLLDSAKELKNIY